MGRYDATFGADKAKRMGRAFKFHALLRRLFFDVLANAILTSATRLDAMTTLIEREVVKSSVEMDFSSVEVFSRRHHGMN